MKKLILGIAFSFIGLGGYAQQFAFPGAEGLVPTPGDGIPNGKKYTLDKNYTNLEVFKQYWRQMRNWN